MTHDRNKTHLPPAKSAREYEAEIATLRARVEKLEGALRPYAQLPHHEECSHYECGLRREALAALSPKGDEA